MRSRLHLVKFAQAVTSTASKSFQLTYKSEAYI